jgi:hypothetical protein
LWLRTSLYISSQTIKESLCITTTMIRLCSFRCKTQIRYKINAANVYILKIINNILITLRFLRSAAGYRRMDKKRNTDMRQNLKILNLGDKIQE